MIQHCPKSRAPHGAVHHVFSSQIRELVENLYSSGFAPASHPSTPPHPTTTPPKTSTCLHLMPPSDPGMLTDAPWQYYHVNEVGLISSAFGRSLVYQKHACQSSSASSIHSGAQCGSHIHSPKVKQSRIHKKQFRLLPPIVVVMHKCLLSYC